MGRNEWGGPDEPTVSWSVVVWRLLLIAWVGAALQAEGNPLAWACLFQAACYLGAYRLLVWAREYRGRMD